MYKRTLEELNLLDDFLFTSVVGYPETGEDFCKILLKTILGREIGSVRITPQKTLIGADTDKRGIRMDVYIEEKPGTNEAQATIYDIEPDNKNSSALLASLPQRVRFYHARVDSLNLKTGDSLAYAKLKRVIVIMITPFDPFQSGRMVYTIKNGCVEEPGMPYDDGARTIFLYTKGNVGNPPEELKNLLRYMEESSEANAANEELRSLHRLVETVKHDREVSTRYMKAFEREMMVREEGRLEGEAAGRAKGECLKLISLVCKKLTKGCSVDEIAAMLEESPDTIRSICDAAASCTPEYDAEQIYALLHR